MQLKHGMRRGEYFAERTVISAILKFRRKRVKEQEVEEDRERRERQRNGKTFNAAFKIRTAHVAPCPEARAAKCDGRHDAKL